jgi:NitT/TauT family transport system permease protein
MSTTRESTAPLALLSTGPAKTSSKRRRLPQGWEGVALFVGILVLWQVLVGILPAQKRFLFPAPGQVAKALWDSLPELGRGTLSSFLILVPGYVSAVAAGIFLGIVAGSTGWFMRLAVPFSRVVAPVPPTVYIPYAIALLPGFRSAATAVVFIGAFWPVFVNSLAGAAAVPARWHDNAHVLGFHKAEFLWRVVLPASLTHVFAGMSVGLAMSFIMLTVAELFGANAGLGRFVQFYADYADYPRMVAGILYTGAITFVCMHGLDALRRKVLFWRH